MLVFNGTVLVLVTWIVAALCLAVVGMPLSIVTHRGAVTTRDVRRSLWWGLLMIAIATYAINFFLPLGSATAALIVLVCVLLGAAISTFLIRRRSVKWAMSFTWPTWLLLGAAVAAIVYLAVAALGPVTNYDSGLYHLGAIRYAAEYASIPGIANIFFPFGYGNAEFPLAALLSNGPWGGDGYRLLNGLIIFLLSVDLVLRMTAKRRSAGTYVLVVSSACVLVPMVALADYWVTSPSQDSAVFAITCVAAALIVDAVARGLGTGKSATKDSVADLACASAAAILLVMLRPTMIAFLAGTLLVAAVLLAKRKDIRTRRTAIAIAVVGAAGVAAAIVMTARDYVLSGWLQYPLSVLAFDVPWRAADPVNDRIATLGYHRDPSDLWNAAQSWDWIPGWLTRLPQQWETFALLGLAVVAVVLLAIARGRTELRGRALLLAMSPSSLAIAVWWLASPPSFRFAWGPVFTLVAIPIGWAVWRLASTGAASNSNGKQAGLFVAVIGLAILSVVVLSSVTRLDIGSISDERSWRAGISIPYAVAPVPLVETAQATLAKDLIVQVPTADEQCWEAFPLCTARPDPAVAGRGGSLQDGFARTD